MISQKEENVSQNIPNKPLEENGRIIRDIKATKWQLPPPPPAEHITTRRNPGVDDTTKPGCQGGFKVISGPLTTLKHMYSIHS